MILIVAAVAAMFFAGFFAYTFVARQHLERIAHDFVTSETQDFAAPIIDAAETALKAPAVRKSLTQDQLDAFDHELAEYRRNPVEFVGTLTGKLPPAVVKKFKNPVLEKVADWKLKVRSYYRQTLSRLVSDLRLFAGSNVVAAVISFALAFRANEKAQRRLAWMSLLLCVAIGCSTSIYFDQLTFFRILSNSFLGWWYPVILLVAFVALLFDYGHLLTSKMHE